MQDELAELGLAVGDRPVSDGRKRVTDDHRAEAQVEDREPI